ncbi:MAG: hypothetical protein WC862_04095 [Patescibacteria group bacterium]
MKKNTALWLVAVVVVLVGVYYFKTRPTTEPASKTQSAIIEEETNPAAEVTEEKEAAAEAEEEAAITLRGEAQGDGLVKFDWETMTEPGGSDQFVLVRGPEENPVHDGTRYWFRQHGTLRSAVWGSQPAGTQHYRMCVVADEQTGACGEYSNDVEVEVK